jgi:hypothetical protein
MKKLHRIWAGQVEFVDVVIRQAHPGPEVPPYRNFEQKMHDGEKFKREEGILSQVLVDDLPGTVHQVYGGLPDPTYVIDADGRVAFYDLWTHAPTLHRALETLKRQGGRGVVKSGYDRAPHFLSAMTAGWKGLRRGWPQSYIELETSAPGMAAATWLGYQFRGVLRPIALRATPLPKGARFALGGMAAGLFVLGLKALTRPKKKRGLRCAPSGRRQGWLR